MGLERCLGYCLYLMALIPNRRIILKKYKYQINQNNTDQIDEYMIIQYLNRLFLLAEGSYLMRYPYDIDLPQKFLVHEEFADLNSGWKLS